MLTELASREKVIGVKQSARAIRDGRAQRVFLACDADELVLEPIRSACGSLPVEEGYTMAQLGRACGIGGSRRCNGSELIWFFRNSF